MKTNQLILLLLITYTPFFGQNNELIIQENRTTPIKVVDYKVVKLNEGENVFDKDLQLNITFIKVLKDNRCPQGVNCMIAGEGVVEIELMSIYSRPKKLILSTTTYENSALKTITFNGYEVSLGKLLPEPSINKSKNTTPTIQLIFSKSDSEREVNPQKKCTDNKNSAKLLENYNSSTTEFEFRRPGSKAD